MSSICIPRGMMRERKAYRADDHRGGCDSNRFPPQIFLAFYRNMEYNLGEVVVRFVVPSVVTAQQPFQIKRVTMMLSVSVKGMVIWFFYRLATVIIDRWEADSHGKVRFGLLQISPS